MNKLIFLLLLATAVCFTSCEKDTFMPEVELASEEASTDTREEATAKAITQEAAIFVHWGKEGVRPVVGANVFDANNKLIGTTGDDGYAYFTVTGTASRTYRVVEPNYGRQQATLTYPADFSGSTLSRQGDVINIQVAGAGWTINSGVY